MPIRKPVRVLYDIPQRMHIFLFGAGVCFPSAALPFQSNCLFLLLMRAENLRVHASKVEIDIILLLLFRPLYNVRRGQYMWSHRMRLQRQVSQENKHTGASMHILICCSSTIQPCAACPEEAQHPSIINIHNLATHVGSGHTQNRSHDASTRIRIRLIRPSHSKFRQWRQSWRYTELWRALGRHLENVLWIAESVREDGNSLFRHGDKCVAGLKTRPYFVIRPRR